MSLWLDTTLAVQHDNFSSVQEHERCKGTMFTAEGESPLTIYLLWIYCQQPI